MQARIQIFFFKRGLGLGLVKTLEKLHVYLSYKHNYMHRRNTCKLYNSFFCFCFVPIFFNSREEIDPSGSASIMYALRN